MEKEFLFFVWIGMRVYVSYILRFYTLVINKKAEIGLAKIQVSTFENTSLQIQIQIQIHFIQQQNYRLHNWYNSN